MRSRPSTDPSQHVGLEAGQFFRARRRPVLTQVAHQSQSQPAPLDFIRDDRPSPWTRSLHGDRGKIRTTRRQRAKFPSPGPGPTGLSRQPSHAQEPRDYCSRYRSDDPDDPDRLNRDAEAAALAEMITARSARPPLAIGLFGDWGEGKTHFLRRIADHVGKLAASARDDPDDRLTHSAVRQVHFNAWHYAETDLWASLVTELFSQMAAGLGDPGAEERRQSRLAAELAARRQRLQAAQDRQQALRQESGQAGRPALDVAAAARPAGSGLAGRPGRRPARPAL